MKLKAEVWRVNFAQAGKEEQTYERCLKWWKGVHLDEVEGGEFPG